MNGRSILSRYFHSLVDFFFPRLCEICGCRLSLDEEMLCFWCNSQMPRTHHHLNPLDNSLARRFWGLIQVERCAAWMRYDGGSEAITPIINMKYHNRPDIAHDIGVIMAKEWQPSGFFEGIEGIVAIPLTPGRMAQRGYNQTEQLANGISEVTGIPVMKNIIKRTRFDDSQTHLGHWERMDNVDGVFSLEDMSPIMGRHILIVDDVVTTGATIISIGREISRVPGVTISVACIAMGHG